MKLQTKLLQIEAKLFKHLIRCLLHSSMQKYTWFLLPMGLDSKYIDIEDI